MPQLPHQYRLVNEVVLHNQDMRLRSDEADLAGRALLEHRPVHDHVPVR